MLIKNSPVGWGIPLSNGFIRNYIIFWVTLVVVVLIITFLKRNEIKKQREGYFEFLTVKWKILTFLVSCFFVTFGGYWTNDETWDFISGLGMSVFTFLFAPLSIGILYRFALRRESLLDLFLACVFSLVAISWFYDGYLALRDGVYTERWFGNLILSSVIYFCAGLFWNLELGEANQIRFSFSRSDWPHAPKNRKIAKAFLLAIPIGLVALFFIIGFVGWSL